MALYTNVAEAELTILLEHGFHRAEAKKYETVRYLGPCTVILFDSGKLLLQGRDDAVKKTQTILAQHRIGKLVPSLHFKTYTGSYVGSDECMKGDTFGGIVVAGVKANDEQRKQLVRLGVADSKTLDDTDIVRIAEELKKYVPHTVHSLTAAEYNTKIKNGTVTALLNELHTAVRQKLGNGIHIVDKFPGCRTGDRAETHAEKTYVEVAAASILARASCLEQFRMLERKAGFVIPRGSSQVKQALAELQKRKLPFESFVKLHFKNVREYL